MKDLKKTSLELVMESALVNCKNSGGSSSSNDECICAATGLSRSDEHEAFS